VDADESASAKEDETLVGDLLANSADPDTPRAGLSITNFTVNGVTYPAGSTADLGGSGTLTVFGNGTYVFVPTPNYNGPVPPVSYVLTDGSGGYDSSTLTITITPVDDGPSDPNESVTTPEDTPVSTNLLINATDPDTPYGDKLSICNYTLPDGSAFQADSGRRNVSGYGMLTIFSNGTLVFEPTLNWNGQFAVQYTVCDTNSPINTDASTVTIKVEPGERASDLRTHLPLT
jgi:hypothetical protein